MPSQALDTTSCATGFLRCQDLDLTATAKGRAGAFRLPLGPCTPPCCWGLALALELADGVDPQALVGGHELRVERDPRRRVRLQQTPPGGADLDRHLRVAGLGHRDGGRAERAGDRPAVLALARGVAEPGAVRERAGLQR